MNEMATKEKERKGESQVETTRGTHFVPHVDIFETDTDLWLHADMPGVRPENVEMNYQKGELSLHARVGDRPRPETVLVKEFETGDFHRVFTVHESIDAARIEATCKNGVLTVRLPKREAVRPRQIKVSAE